jgi:hypothetical protein
MVDAIGHALLFRERPRQAGGLSALRWCGCGLSSDGQPPAVPCPLRGTRSTFMSDNTQYSKPNRHLIRALRNRERLPVRECGWVLDIARDGE